MSVKPLRSTNLGLDRRAVAAENRRLADEEAREAHYHSEMAVCLTAVGDTEAARVERNRATVLLRSAQIKRDLAQKGDPQGRGTR
jgi:hypothetical protein